MFSPLPPIGGHENFFGTRDLRQSISRARKPPSTKNQPIWSQNKKVEKIDFLTWGTPVVGQKNFFGTRDLRQSISRARKPPSTKNQPIWRKKFFREAYWACTLPLSIRCCYKTDYNFFSKKNCYRHIYIKIVVQIVSYSKMWSMRSKTCQKLDLWFFENLSKMKVLA